MSKKTRIIFEIIVVAAIISGLAFYFYNQYQKSIIKEDSQIELIRQIVTLKFVKGGLSQEIKDKYKEIFIPQAEKFLDNPYSAEAFWPLIQIGQIKRLSGDYQGAKEAFIWVVELQPKSYLAHGNLADVYFRHFQDFVKAEEHYLKAIESDSPQTVKYYFELHEIYHYFHKQETALAEDILKQGIEKFSQETDLMSALARYYKKIGRYEEAREYYLKILEINPDSQVAKKGLEDL